MDEYGIDKPDLRFTNKLQDWTEQFSNCATPNFNENIKQDTYSVKAVVFQKGIELSLYPCLMCSTGLVYMDDRRNLCFGGNGAVLLEKAVGCS